MLKKAFGTLVSEFSPQVLNTAMRILGDMDKAQDVHQEVFLAVWKRWHTYNGQTNWRAYLYRVTIREAMQLARQRRSEQSLLEQVGCTASDQRPEGTIRTEELQVKLAHHLAKLPKRQAEVFVLARIEGLDAQQIAQCLGCSAGTVRVHLHRAAKRLADELSDYLTE